MKNYFPIRLCLLISVATLINGDISISLTDTSDQNREFKKYSVIEFFTTRYANTDPLMYGNLHNPKVANICLYVPTISGEYIFDPQKNQSVVWFAVVNDSTDCLDDIVTNIRNAGYKLLITKASKLTNQIRNMGFPIVLVSSNYLNYLADNSPFFFFDPYVEAHVSTGMIWSIVLVVLIFGIILISCCCCCVCCFWCFIRRRQRRFLTQNFLAEERRQNYNRLQNSERIARRELIESILRQLQQLQLDAQSQLPLGAEHTHRLPTRKYSKEVEDQEMCVICVDNFKDGDLQRVLPCNHFFHIECIDEWLINHSDLCPLCKKQVPKDQVDLVMFDSSESSQENLLPCNRDHNGRSQYGSV